MIPIVYKTRLSTEFAFTNSLRKSSKKYRLIEQRTYQRSFNLKCRVRGSKSKKQPHCIVICSGASPSMYRMTSYQHRWRIWFQVGCLQFTMLAQVKRNVTNGLNFMVVDSKVLSEEDRERLFETIKDCEWLQWLVDVLSPEYISGSMTRQCVHVDFPPRISSVFAKVVGGNQTVRARMLILTVRVMST